MSLQFYQYILLFILFYIIHKCIKSLLQLRYHFQFGRVGFFSISNVKYQHHKLLPIWSISVGKLKIRLRKNPTISSPTIYITIHIKDITLQIQNLSALKTKSAKKSENSQFNKRLSRVSSSLKKIPWWYSLSIVKKVVKFTSALPAQLLMAGLANYVDVHIENLNLEVEDITSFKIQHIAFSSTLYADVMLPTHSSIPNSKPTMNLQQQEFKFENLFSSSSYQRHSLKQANHLFKEKYFEISVVMGRIAIVDRLEEIPSEALALPDGVHISVSCHLSADCVTLKDIDVKTQIDKFQLKVNPLLSSLNRIKAKASNTTTTPIEKGDLDDSSVERKKNHWFSVFRSMSLSVTQTTIDIIHQNSYSSTLFLNQFQISATLQPGHQPNFDPYYMLKCILISTEFILSNSEEPAWKILQIAEIKSSVNISQISLLGHWDSQSTPLDNDDLKKLNQYLANELKYNRNSVSLNINIQEPILHLDISKLDVIRSLNPTVKKKNRHHHSSFSATYRTFSNLPQISVTLLIEKPALKLSQASKEHTGLIQCSDIALDMYHSYACHKRNLPTTTTTTTTCPEPKSPTSDEECTVTPLNRSRSQNRPSWMNLFRRSWRLTRDYQEMTEQDEMDWTYKAVVHFCIKDAGFYVLADALLQKEDGVNQFLFLKTFEVNADTRLQAIELPSSSRHKAVQVIWDLDHPQESNLNIEIHQPRFNSWKTLSANHPKKHLDFWINDVLHSFRKSTSVVVEEEEDLKKKRSVLLRYGSMVKTSVSLTDSLFVLEGVDKGLKGKRNVPSGFLDNAPEDDTWARLTIAIQKIQLNFIGISRARDSSTSSESLKMTRDNDRLPLAITRLTLHHISVKRSFKKAMDKLNNVYWHQDKEKTALLLWISQINVRTEIVKENGTLSISPSIVVKKIGVQYSITNHYACLVVLLSTVSEMKQLFGQGTRTPKVNQTKSAKKINLGQLNLQINRTDVHLFLPYSTEVYLRMDTLRSLVDNQQIASHGEVPSIDIRNLTMYGVAPGDSMNKWDQLLELDNIQFSILKDVDFSTAKITKQNQLLMAKFYLRIPYGYELSNVVDSSVTLIKAIKATHARLLKGVQFLFFGPTEKKTPAILPNIRLVCHSLTFQFEDDPFEARLRSIFKAGLVEQLNRNAIQEAFEIKVQTLMDQYASSKNNNSHFDSDSIYLNNEADARVNEAWQGLQEHNSKSWKRHIDTAIGKEKSTYETLQSSYYRRTIIAEQLDELAIDNDRTLSDVFSIDIVELPQFPPLLDLTINQTSLDFSPPDFDLEETRQFIYDVGKGQPLDTPLSTLVPFHLHWKSGKTWAQLRDYPIPFFLVPDDEDEDTTDNPLNIGSKQKGAWSLSGNYVLADDMGSLDATRSIRVPIVDGTYDIDIARVTTPLKFFSIVNIEVHNSTLTHICWCVPYQPAIQDITRVLDTFTKSPVDPSEKVGFWDKIRLIIHTRAKISFVGGGDLAIVMKGTRDPYDLSEKGFGLAKVWRNNVVCLLGHDNPQGEFMQIISCDYAFGVPDLLQGGYTASYIVAAAHPPKEDKDNGPSKIRHTVSMSSFNSSSGANKHSQNKSRFIKIALKMTDGIRMGVGCHLERMCNPNCEICDEDNDILPEAREVHKSRLLQFLPHFKVKLKAPHNVHEENYDAYRGFRSDFIHLSISIIKLSTNETETEKKSITGNSMHITPGFLDHFGAWFRLFGGAMGYPLRAGSLFPKADKRPSQKFGRHMRTMKYKVVINPLTVGCFIKDENVIAEDMTTEELGDSVGLKGFVDEFSVDIHQRREIVNVSDQKLDQKRLKANWPLAEAEVQLKNIDLRAVKAKYNAAENVAFFSSSSTENISVPVPMENYYSDDSDHGLNMMEGLNYQCHADSDSSDWVDLDDFIELGVSTPGVLPAIQVLPFAFAPCIYYLRQSNRGDIKKYRYLHNTHDCILGTATDTREMQMSLLRDRSNNIDIQIRKHQARLHNIETRRLQHGEDEKSLEEMSDAIVEKTRLLYEKRELLQQYLKDLSTEEKFDPTDSKKFDINTQSRIFGKDSLSQWEELMGHFKIRYIAHNPQILWNNSVRNILYHALDLKDHRRALSYYMTSRTIKFLRDMIDASKMNYHNTQKYFVLDDDEGGMDPNTVENLITKLLLEKDTKFVAENETEEGIKLDGTEAKDGIQTGDCINDPHVQLKSIPNNYVMKSSYLIDLLNPQISLQSDCDPDNIVLVANERTQVKAFNIIDETDPDAEMELVKHRTIVSLDNLQFFVAKKEKFDSVDLLLDNHYGAKESDHWLAWIPPEMLINYVKSSDKFQRIGDRIAATLQYDKYNQLRIKADVNNTFSQVHPFEDRCDSVRLNFPRLRLTADSSQYNAIYQVATDLLLYKEPAKQERLARLREIMMAADRASLFETTEKIADLQNRARQLIHARDQYRQNIVVLDSRQIEAFKSVRLELYDTLEELYLGMEAIKLMQSNQRKDYHEPKTNLKFIVCADKVEWEILSAGEVPLCECILTKFSFNFVSKEDHASINTLEVDVVQVKNISPSPVFVDVLGPFVDTRKPYDFSRHKMLRCYFVSLAPVGGIPVIQHLEINLHPMRLQMTYSFGKALANYLFPPEKEKKQLENTSLVNSTSTPTNTMAAVLSAEPESFYDRSSTHDSTPVTQLTSGNDHATSRSFSYSNNTVSAPPSLYASNSTTTESQKCTPKVDSDTLGVTKEELDSQETAAEVIPSKKSRKLTKNKFNTTDDLSVMKKRASSNRTFILVKIPGAKHCLSYQGPKEKNIEDLRDFAFEQPTLEFRNEIWSWFELVKNVKKDFMKAALLHNSTALLKEKILRRHPRENPRSIEPSASLYSVPVIELSTDKTSGKSGTENENNSESSRDDLEEMLDNRDTASLYSGLSQENWDIEAHEQSKKTHIWSKFKKNKKQTILTDISKCPPDLNNIAGMNSGFSFTHDKVEGPPPALMTSSTSEITRHLQDNDQLVLKGRYLLGKHYTGPTHWLGHKGNKTKGIHLVKNA